MGGMTQRLLLREKKILVLNKDNNSSSSNPSASSFNHSASDTGTGTGTPLDSSISVFNLQYFKVLFSRKCI